MITINYLSLSCNFVLEFLEDSNAATLKYSPNRFSRALRTLLGSPLNLQVSVYLRFGHQECQLLIVAVLLPTVGSWLERYFWDGARHVLHDLLPGLKSSLWWALPAWSSKAISHRKLCEERVQGGWRSTGFLKGMGGIIIEISDPQFPAVHGGTSWYSSEIVLRGRWVFSKEPKHEHDNSAILQLCYTVSRPDAKSHCPHVSSSMGYW